jgi:hypothetical protein
VCVYSATANRGVGLIVTGTQYVVMFMEGLSAESAGAVAKLYTGMDSVDQGGVWSVHEDVVVPTSDEDARGVTTTHLCELDTRFVRCTRPVPVGVPVRAG